jgi:hypothetical protein
MPAHALPVSGAALSVGWVECGGDRCHLRSRATAVVNARVGAERAAPKGQAGTSANCEGAWSAAEWGVYSEGCVRRRQGAFVARTLPTIPLVGRMRRIGLLALTEQ